MPLRRVPSSRHLSSSSIPYVPALPPPAPAPPLPEAPAAIARRPLSDLLHNVTWAVARAFGFQAFNASASQWAPATAFLAADHLEALILRNIMPRMTDSGADRSSGGGKAAGGSGGDEGESHQPEGSAETTERQGTAFARSVWELHSHIFLPYEGTAGWCRHVGLAPRLSGAESDVLGSQAGDASPVLHLLLCELALYFLLYSEAANLRHTPELICI
ncbi:hypothetical protein GPECTOR_1g649 [Gonium pectorale]|uniref:Uncharacterized protein n=1 Tax=Gonium pectorale TaxID=33097 RepID=A0A150H527_GONPE|nr:hypothetical protein GPECTOR_1g649 [Gonium pectorale]|eukprot:KXZ56720.1 hypothetical protein GPECTOR_1g649 [Gonium pectorale]